MEVLNLYSCLGGNRLLWDNCNVTAVELDPILAELYQDRFPNDTVIVGDAHSYLLENFKRFDFIWSSPPCPSHSRARYWANKGNFPAYPDMTLYQEIVLLEKWFSGFYVVENVIPYYTPLIPAQKRGRHLYWSNFKLPADLGERKQTIMATKNEVKKWSEFHAYDFSLYKNRGGGQRIEKIARNLVDYIAGKAIFDAARNLFAAPYNQQLELTF